MKTLSLILFLALICSGGFAQKLNPIDNLRQALAIAKNDSGRIEIIRRLSLYFDGVSQDSSMFYMKKGMDLAKKINFPYGEAIMSEKYGHFYWISGDYPKALSVAFRGLKIAEAIRSPRAILLCTNIIGLVYSDLKDYDVAIDYFQKALKINASVKNITMEANLYGNLLRTYRNANQLDSALVYAKKIENDEKFFKAGSNTLYTYIADIQFYFKNYTKAFQNIHKSILINKTKNDHRQLSTAYLQIAKFFKKLNQSDSCIFYAKNALFEAQSVGSMKNVLESSNILAELYDSKSLKEALYYNKISKSVTEELYGASKVLGLQKIIADEQKRQREIEEERIVNQNRVKQYVLFTGIGVLLLIAFILYRNNRQKHKANAVLENTLSKLKSTQAQLIQSEKLASLGELTAGIAHEIQNPLNFVNNFSEVSAELVEEMNQELDKGEVLGAKEIANDLKQNLEKINLHGKRASSIVKGMLEHSRTSSGEKELIDINKLAEEYLRLSFHGLRAKDSTFNSDFRTEFDKNLPKIEVIPQDMGRVLLNLINNAFYAVKNVEKPLVTVKTEQTENQIIIKVSDNGTGMAEDVKAKIFQPFFTTKPTGQGTGLGLSLAYDIVTKGHGGTLEVESTEGVGSEFIISLPFKTNVQ